MAKQYNSEIEKELHLLRLSNERIEKEMDECIGVFNCFTAKLKLYDVPRINGGKKSGKKGST